MNPNEVLPRVQAMLRARNPHVAPLPDVLLGSDGLGLDSIALVELLLECEDVFGVSVAADLLGGAPMTVALLADVIGAHCGAAAAR